MSLPSSDDNLYHQFSSPCTGNDEKCLISCKKIRPAFQLSKVNIYLKENILETWPEMQYQCQTLKVDGL